MKQILVSLLIFISLESFAVEDYAVVIGSHTELMNKEGFIVQKLRKGTVVKVKVHPKDKEAAEVEFEGKQYIGALRNFRVIESLLDEEVVMLKKVSILRKKILLTETGIEEKNQEFVELNEKILRINRWLEVQKDNAFSNEYFLTKTKKVRTLFKDLTRKRTLLKIERESLVEELKASKYELTEEDTVLKALQSKLKPLKAEKSLFDKGFMTIEIIAKAAPVFHDGNIVKYLKKKSRLKVGVDHMSGDWYVMTKGEKRYYIASTDVQVKF